MDAPDGTVSLCSVMPERDFAEINRNLDETLSKLRAANDPTLRHKLLREMRDLIAEAHRSLNPESK